MSKKNIAIIGGGILGLAIAFKLSRKNPNIFLFEKEKDLGKHQSGNNSGVLHSGLYYKPKSLKAMLAVKGIREMIKFCNDYEIEHDVCGKIVVAGNERELKILEDLALRGKKNGLQGLKFLNNQELKMREPNVIANGALLVPEEGIVSYSAVMKKMEYLIKEASGHIYFGEKIESVLKSNSGKFVLKGASIDKEFDTVINCTGLHSDRTYKKFTNQKRPLRIIPFRGEYMNIKKEYTSLINHLVYPVPDPKFPFLGVHFTRMINGGREVGPNAVLAFKREGYSNKQFSLNDTIDTLTYPGFLKFIKNNLNFTISEFLSSLSINSFVNKAKKMVPDVECYMLEKGTSGVRAQAMDNNGDLIMDFKIFKFENQIHVLNAPSPGATASLAIADHIIENYNK